MAMYTLFVAFSLNNPLIEGHAFRQSQTAFVARQFAANGIDLLRPIVPIYGPNSAVPFELPWFQAVASLGIRYLHLPEIVALRGTALFSTILTACFIQRIVQRFSSREVGETASVLYLLTPFTVQWGRASLIETFTTAVVLAWLTVLTKKRIAGLDLCFGTLLGIVAWTSKLTTAAPWAIIIVLPLAVDFREKRWRELIGRLGSVAIGVAAGLAWSHHADLVKQRNPFTADLTMGKIRTFNFGTLGQRLTLSTWTTIFSRTAFLMLGGIGIACVFAGIYCWKSTQSALPLGLAAVVIVPLLTFTNLYVVHDYYQAAFSPAIAALEAVGLVGIVNRVSPDGFAHISRWIGTAVLATSSFIVGWQYAAKIFKKENAFTAEAQLARNATPSNDGIAVSGLGWDPEFVYQTGRWGFALSPTRTTAMALKTDFGKRLTTMVVAGGIGQEWRNFLSQTTWLAPISRYTYRVGWDPPQAKQTKYPFLIRNIEPIETDLDEKLACNQPASQLAIPPRLTNYEISFDGTAVTDVVLNDLAPVPLHRGVVEVRAGTPLRLKCTGVNNAFISVHIEPEPTSSVSAMSGLPRMVENGAG